MSHHLGGVAAAVVVDVADVHSAHGREAGVRPVELLLEVAPAIAVAVLELVGNNAVGHAVVGMRTREVLTVVGEPIAVGIEIAVGHCWSKAQRELEPFGDTVSVGIAGEAEGVCRGGCRSMHGDSAGERPSGGKPRRAIG